MPRVDGSCSGGGVDGRLPVLTQGQFKVLFRAYQDSFLGVVWDRQRWVDELGGKDLTRTVAHVNVTLGATQVRNFEDAADQVLRHSIPATTSRTNLKDGGQARPLKSQMFGAAEGSWDHIPDLEVSSCPCCCSFVGCMSFCS